MTAKFSSVLVAHDEVGEEGEEERRESWRACSFCGEEKPKHAATSIQMSMRKKKKKNMNTTMIMTRPGMRDRERGNN